MLTVGSNPRTAAAVSQERLTQYRARGEWVTVGSQRTQTVFGDQCPWAVLTLEKALLMLGLLESNPCAAEVQKPPTCIIWGLSRSYYAGTNRSLEC